MHSTNDMAFSSNPPPPVQYERNGTQLGLLFQAGLTLPWVSAKFELRCERLKSRFSLILFADNLIIDTLKSIEKIIRESAFDKKIKKPGLKFNPG